MSFKRDTIDTSLLRNLKFRRVSEILAQQIPEDEARLLSNGRLTCVVCMHRPIFDNINMLSIHRKGRRHIAELSKYLLHKREIQLKMQKSSQLLELRAAARVPGVNLNDVSMVNDGDSATSCANTNQKSHPLLTSSPYSSCVKKRSQKIPLAMQRRMVLEFPKSPPLSSALMMENSKASQPTSAHSEVRRYLKGIQRKKPFSKLMEKMKEGYSLPQSEQGTSSGREANLCAVVQSSSELKTSSTNSDIKTKEDEMLQNTIGEHNLKLSMAGWIWETNADGGKWVKDPNAEFDSDEEEPPPMD